MTPLPEEQEHLCEDAIVFGYHNGVRHLLMIERARNPRFWAVPGGRIEPTDKEIGDAARRELLEEVGLDLPLRERWLYSDVRIQPDDRPGVWKTRACIYSLKFLPSVVPLDGALRVGWFRALSMERLGDELWVRHRGKVWPTHEPMLTDYVDGVR